jgi:hypothetical protein
LQVKAIYLHYVLKKKNDLLPFMIQSFFQCFALLQIASKIHFIFLFLLIRVCVVLEFSLS